VQHDERGGPRKDRGSYLKTKFHRVAILQNPLSAGIVKEAG
jgi:hypothetical protein